MKLYIIDYRIEELTIEARVCRDCYIKLKQRKKGVIDVTGDIDAECDECGEKAVAY